ncbi:hypothetical protein D3C72_1632680 [compost metagenome]
MRMVRAATAQPSASSMTTSSAMISQLLALSITTRVPAMTQLSARFTCTSPLSACSTEPEATPSTRTSPCALKAVPPTRLRCSHINPPCECRWPYTSPWMVMSLPSSWRCSCTSPYSSYAARSFRLPVVRLLTPSRLTILFSIAILPCSSTFT